MAHEYTLVDDTDTEAVGLLAFSALVVMTRLAKSGDQTPNIKAHIGHTHMSARASGLFERLETQAGHHDCDPHEAMGQHSGLYDNLGAKTRPSTWSGRSVKTYVTLGIIGDFLREMNERHGLFSTNLDMRDLNQGDWERDHLAPQIGRDPQLATRLSLWARRVTGEVLGLVRVILFTHPAPTKEPDTADGITALVMKRHSERIAQINLKA